MPADKPQHRLPLSRYSIIYKLNFPNQLSGKIGYMIEVIFPVIKHSAKQQCPNHVTVYTTFTPYWDSVLGRRQTLYKLLAFIASSAVLFQILPQAKRRVEISPDQSKPRQWEKKQQCKPLKRVYKAVGCMSERFISQESTKSAQCSSRALA